jgi:4-hydroxy-3-methylbut-2-en-1-yl diphosphate reductase
VVPPRAWVSAVFGSRAGRLLDDTDAVIEVLRRRFPGLEAPAREDICCATTNRQRAVKAILGEIDLLLVSGSRNSSNSNRLVEVARSRGVDVHLIEDESEIDEAWLCGSRPLAWPRARPRPSRS